MLWLNILINNEEDKKQRTSEVLKYIPLVLF